MSGREPEPRTLLSGHWPKYRLLYKDV
ncbi:hypothetical protein CCACVL1_20788 [Corchorus capsularis]|uniref:Uncharacterized protein n=1 Tax=Corchorus capsularis TaxID=210143 RepID=A0A1R3H9S6_COCAP|nr:hypothetical protein CCACVL1_20788 [Corchorus capsularis]